MKNILIIEDETPAFNKLLGYLDELIKIPYRYKWVKSVHEAREMLTSNEEYTLIISDIQLRDENIFDFLLGHLSKVPVIFCSAYNDYFSQAFQTNGIAYILKPYEKSNLKMALEKYQLLFEDTEKLKNTEKLLKEFHLAVQQKQNYKDRLICKNAINELQLVQVNEISMIVAKGDFSQVVTRRGAVYYHASGIGNIEKLMDPKLFYRINRSEIVHLAAIEKIVPYFKNRLLIQLEGIETKVRTTSAKTANFRVWLEG